MRYFMPPAILRALVLYVCQRGAYAPRYDYVARMRVLKYRGGFEKALYSESLGFIGTCVSLKKSWGHMQGKRMRTNQVEMTANN